MSAQHSSVTLLHDDPAPAGRDEADRDQAVWSPLTDITPAGPVVSGPRGDLQLTLDDVRGYRARRTRLSTAEGMGIGALAGLVLGAAAGFSAGDDPPCMSTAFLGCLFYDRQTAGQKAAIAGTLSGIGGALVGGLVGYLVGHTDVFVF